MQRRTRGLRIAISALRRKLLVFADIVRLQYKRPAKLNILLLLMPRRQPPLLILHDRNAVSLDQPVIASHLQQPRKRSSTRQEDADVAETTPVDKVNLEEAIAVFFDWVGVAKKGGSVTGLKAPGDKRLMYVNSSTSASCTDRCWSRLALALSTVAQTVQATSRLRRRTAGRRRAGLCSTIVWHRGGRGLLANRAGVLNQRFRDAAG